MTIMYLYRCNMTNDKKEHSIYVDKYTVTNKHIKYLINLFLKNNILLVFVRFGRNLYYKSIFCYT